MRDGQMKNTVGAFIDACFDEATAASKDYVFDMSLLAEHFADTAKYLTVLYPRDVEEMPVGMEGKEQETWRDLLKSGLMLANLCEIDIFQLGKDILTLNRMLDRIKQQPYEVAYGLLDLQKCIDEMKIAVKDGEKDYSSDVKLKITQSETKGQAFLQGLQFAQEKFAIIFKYLEKFENEK